MIEVLVVICGLAILAGIGVPALDTLLSRYGTVMAAQQISTQLQNARMKAVSMNEPFRVRFASDTNSYRIETANGTLHAGPFFLPSGTTFNTHDGHPITFSGNYVLFQPSGSPPTIGDGSAGRVKIINRDGLKVDIVVAIGGMVRATPTYTSSTPPF